MSGSVTGTVKWFDSEKGYGFFKLPDGKLDVFFHIKQLRTSGINRALKEGEVAEFVVSSGPKGHFAEQIKVTS